MDTAYGWRYAPWYLGAASWVVAGGFGLADGSWPVGAAAVAGGAVWAVLATRSLLRCRRTPEALLRAELLVLARMREGTADGWLNRDARQIFTVDKYGPRWLRSWNVCRADEEILLELHSTGRVAATAEVFALLPVTTDIHRYTAGAVIEGNDEGDYEITYPEQPGGKVRRAVRTLRGQRRADKAGLLHAGRDELRDLIDRFREAEPDKAHRDGEGE